jgi:hypothetical protein
MAALSVDKRWAERERGRKRVGRRRALPNSLTPNPSPKERGVICLINNFLAFMLGFCFIWFL